MVPKVKVSPDLMSGDVLYNIQHDLYFSQPALLRRPAPYP